MLYVNPDYRLREENDGAGLMSDSDGAVFVLNRVAMFVMTAIHERPQESEEIVHAVRRNFSGVDDSVMEKEVRDFLAQALEQGLLMETNSPGATKAEPAASQPG